LSDPLLIGATALNFFGEELVWCSFSTYVPEAYPSVIRSVANGLIAGTAHLGAVVSGFGGPFWMDLNVYLPFYLNSLAYIVGAGFSLLLKKDTAGQPLLDEDPATPRDYSEDDLEKVQ